MIERYPDAKLIDGEWGKKLGTRIGITGLRDNFDSGQVDLFDHLGAKGWEAVNFRGNAREGYVWFKRMIANTDVSI